MAQANWTTVWSDEIFDLVVRPKIESVLKAGVTDKSDFAQKFGEAYGFTPTPNRTNSWLKRGGYLSLFEKPALIQLEEVVVEEVAEEFGADDLFLDNSPPLRSAGPPSGDGPPRSGVLLGGRPGEVVPGRPPV